MSKTLIQSKNPNYILAKEYLIEANYLLGKLKNKEYVRLSYETNQRLLPIRKDELKVQPVKVHEINSDLQIIELEPKLFIILNEDTNDILILNDRRGGILTAKDKIMDLVKKKIAKATKAEVVNIEKGVLPEYVFHLAKSTERNEFKDYKILGERIILRIFFDEAFLSYTHFNWLFSAYIQRNYKRAELS